MMRWGKEKTGKGLSVASRAKAYLPGGGMSYGVPDEALIHAWSEWLAEAMRHIDELEAELGGGKEETAEERVRAAVDMSEPPLQADLRATLAELDRARAELTRARGAVESSERIRRAFYAELTELRAQRPVDVEAVLAPIRTVSDSYAHQIASHENESDRRARAEQFNDALWHHTRGVGLGLARNELIRALAEAEKIGRGK